MWQRFTERARRVVFFAQEEAMRLGDQYVSTEHLLLGLIRENDSVAAQVLDRLGVSLGRIRSEIERQVTQGDRRPGSDMQLTPRAKRVIDLAYDEARQLNNNYIGTEHLLLGLIREGEGLAGRVLAKLGVDLERTRREVIENVIERQGSDTPSEPLAAATMIPLIDLVKQFLVRLKTPKIREAAQSEGLDIEGEIERLGKEINRVEQETAVPPRPSVPHPTVTTVEIASARKAIQDDFYSMKGKS